MRNTVETQMDLKTHISTLTLAPDAIAARTSAIRSAMLERSKCVRVPNFERISIEDLRLLFDEYDREFFGGLVQQSINAYPRTTLTFRLAPRMTSSGGKTSLYYVLGAGRADAKFEIVISTHLLFSNFKNGDGPVLINGIECNNRLDALMHIYEHELTHLVEILVEGRSSCRAKRFMVIAHRLFGHTDTLHRLLTVRARAARDLGLRVGDTVAFTHEGQRFIGHLNRMTKQATVLVENPKGRLYSNGQHYWKYYVPLVMLSKVGS